MGLITPTLPTPGADRGTEETDVRNCLTALLTLVNGNIDLSNLSAALQAQLADLTTHGYAEVLTDQTTTSPAAADLTTVGPSVTLTVPTNGLVAVRAMVTGGAALATSSLVRLFEDAVDIGTILTIAAPAEVRRSAPGSATGTTVRALGGWLVFEATAGAHVYKLRYSNGGGANLAAFSNRRLWARVLAP